MKITQWWINCEVTSLHSAFQSPKSVILHLKFPVFSWLKTCRSSGLNGYMHKTTLFSATEPTLKNSYYELCFLNYMLLINAWKVFHTSTDN